MLLRSNNGHGLSPPRECGVLLQDSLQAHPWGARAPASLPAHGPEARHRTPLATMVLFKRFKEQYGLFGQISKTKFFNLDIQGEINL